MSYSFKEDSRTCDICGIKKLHASVSFPTTGWSFCYLIKDPVSAYADFHFCEKCRHSKRCKDIESIAVECSNWDSYVEK